MLEDIKDIILIVLVISVIYLIYKTTFSSSEKFDAASDAATALIASNKQMINEAVKNTYKADIDAMRNLAQIADKILIPTTDGNVTDLLDTPATTVRIKNLEVTDNVKFLTKDTNILEIFPKFMIISWAQNDPPIGWALCNGQKYVLKTDKTVRLATDNELAIINNPVWTQTPDLRGRFILGSGTGIIYDSNGNILKDNDIIQKLSPRNLNNTGGKESNTLGEAEIPSHDHKLDFRYVACEGGGCLGGKGLVMDNVIFETGNRLKQFNFTDPGALPHNTSKFGGELVATTSKGENPSYKTKPIDNMPPFYVLTYIMKL
jgi:microcystin-dependent protein